MTWMLTMTINRFPEKKVVYNYLRFSQVVANVKIKNNKK